MTFDKDITKQKGDVFFLRHGVGKFGVHNFWQDFGIIVLPSSDEQQSIVIPLKMHYAKGW